MAIDSALPSLLQQATPACQKDTEALQLIEEVTRNADSVQQELLTEILSSNVETEYLQRFNLSGSTDRDTFKSKVPVVTYEDLEPDIQRIANGDRSAILSVHPISELFASSGTSSGKCKLIPMTEVEMDHRDILTKLRMPVMNQYVPGLDKGKGLYFMFVRVETKTAGGVLTRTTMTSHYKSDHFKARRGDPFDSYTSPDEAIHCLDHFQSLYTQMVCCLLDRQHVLRVGAGLASGLLQAIKFLQLNWPELTHDIRSGTLNPKITDPSIREVMAGILKKPEPELADVIASECSKENWKGIILRIWPSTKYLDTIITGAMAQYTPALEYYGGGLPMASTTYGASEFYVGLNLNPICNPTQVCYTIMPNTAYVEFLPYNHKPSSPNAAVVELADVEVGKEYELVVTTYGGLYRYQVGDILLVIGFHNSAPQVQFVGRKNVVLSIDAIKTDEAQLQKSVDTAACLLRSESNASVVDYTSYADTRKIPGHYVIYWELVSLGVKELLSPDSTAHHSDSAANNLSGPSDELLSRCCLAIEETLDSVYRQVRVEGQLISPLEIRIVKGGTFEELLDYAISRGATFEQYKVSRCVSLLPIIELLDSRVISSHFSPSLPHWNSSFS